MCDCVIKTDRCEPDRKVLIEATASFSDQAGFLKTVRWSHLDGCWLGNLRGMTVGIETDGYVHS